MRIVVIGGTGLIGSKLVRLLHNGGHDVVAASPTTGVNTVTRIGLADALTGADVVVDTADAPSFGDDAAIEYFTISGRHLQQAGTDAGVSHHIALSVVGAERLPNSPYMRAKVVQERLVRTAGISYTILRSTQSYELMRSAADAATDGDVVRISPALVQPIAAQDIAAALATIAPAPPTNGTEEVAGPDPVPLAALAERILHAQHDPRRVEPTPGARYYGSQLDDHTLLPGPEARLGTTRLDDWLRQNVGASDRQARTAEVTA